MRGSRRLFCQIQPKVTACDARGHSDTSVARQCKAFGVGWQRLMHGVISSNFGGWLIMCDRNLCKCFRLLKLRQLLHVRCFELFVLFIIRNQSLETACLDLSWSALPIG